MTTTPRPRRAASRVPAPLRWLGQALSLVMLCASVLAALVLIVVPIGTGSHTYSVLTSSMAPSYEPGTFLVVRPVDYDTLGMGDVVTYQLRSGEPSVVTHRIVGFSSDQEGNRLLITKGDNNDLVDTDPVREVQVRGSLLYAVPKIGYVANALGQADRSMVVNALAAGLIVAGLLTIVQGARKKKAVNEDI